MWHHRGMLTKEDVRAAIKAYESDVKDANERRARFIARAADDMSQKDIIEATGYSRETVRRLTAEGRALPAKLSETPGVTHPIGSPDWTASKSAGTPERSEDGRGE
jgi:hypothetical protein